MKALWQGMLCLGLLAGWGLGTSEASTWSAITTADAFVAVGSGSNPAGADLTNNNYGGAGTLAISSADSVKGEMQSLLKFNLSGAKAQFDAEYGAGAWQITSITLTLASNFGVQGAQPNNNIFNTINAGGFAIEWLGDDSWSEGSGNPGSPGTTGVTYNSLSTLVSGTSEELGTYTYTPPGNNVAVTWTLNLSSGFLSDATAAGDVSFLLHATAGSSVGYLFNARSFASNWPTITITAVPEPGTVSLLLGGATVLGFAAHRRRR